MLSALRSKKVVDGRDRPGHHVRTELAGAYLIAFILPKISSAPISLA